LNAFKKEREKKKKKKNDAFGTTLMTITTEGKSSVDDGEKKGEEAKEVKVFAFDGKRTLSGAAAENKTNNIDKTLLSRKRINVKREMKRFMASETKRIVREETEDAKSNNNNKNDDAKDSKFGMKHMRREVRDFGIKGLNKWDRKELENEKLKELGMKPSKGIRIPATIGVGLWKKNEQRNEEKRLDLFRLGHKLEKKERKKMTNSEKEEKREKESDRGLAWGSSWFKNGILKLKKGDVKKNKVNVDTKVRLSGKNRDAKGSAGGKKSKKGAKGSKKRGAGKKSSRG
jgi:hypothetical protein|tara:strand:- start:5139 stop:5999 length:861 start_codon:yes stop_codon:yes gene_type:complete